MIYAIFPRWFTLRHVGERREPPKRPAGVIMAWAPKVERIFEMPDLGLMDDSQSPSCDGS